MCLKPSPLSVLHPLNVFPPGDHGVPGYEHQDSAQAVQRDVQAENRSHHPGDGHRAGSVTRLLR